MSAAVITNHYINTSSNIPAINEIEIESASCDTNGARYYKNPTPEMLAQAEENNQRMGGMIFIESSGKRGKFIAPKTIKVNQFITETKEIDFSLADFAVPVTTIHVKDFLGGIRITVPPGVRVEEQTVGIISDTKLSKAVSGTSYEDGPLIVVKGAHVLSKVNVKVNNEVPPIAILQ